MTDVVIAKNVRKRFGKIGHVLQDVDLRVKDNEILALMGPNGVGKTILLCCITGGLHPSSGEIRVFGQPPSSREVHTKIGFLLQGALALPYLTGRENIKYYARLHGSSTHRWKQLVERLDITKDLDRLVKDYSGGMKRKIEAITTLTVEAPFYVLDEPTTGLDLSIIHEIHDILLSFKEQGKTILLSTHNPLNAQIADRIAFMRLEEGGGDIVRTGSPKQLLEDVPPVMLLTRPTAKMIQTVKEHTLGHQVFERGGEVRAFLPSSQEIDTIREILEDEAADTTIKLVEKPTYTDMFNYYAKVWKRNEGGN